MADFSEDQVYDFKEGFQLFDLRGDNKISYSQCGDVLRALGQNPTEAEVMKVLGNPKLDEMNTKLLSFEQFLPMMQTVNKNKDLASVEEIVEGFKAFDKEGNGKIASSEMRHALTSLGEKMSEYDVECLLSPFEDANGCIDYEELIRKVLSG